MSGISRRQFVASAAAAGAVALSSRFGFGKPESTTLKHGNDIVQLGNSGIETSVLGIGTGTRGGSEQRAMGSRGFEALVRHALDRGLRYIDTADAYQMHVFVRLALEKVPKDKYFVQTKTRATHPEVAKADIERFRRELKVPYLDTLLMHCMQKGGWTTDMRPVMDVLYEAKEKEQVRAVGVSCHGMDPLITSSDCDWCDVHLVRINPFQMKMDGAPDDVASQIAKMKEAGHGVLGMKIFGESGYETPEKRLQSLKYVLNLGTVDAFTIGFTSTAQIDETMDMIEQATA